MDDFTHKFDLLYSKGAFAYWFVGEGLESGEMMHCREEYNSLIYDYKEVTSDSKETD
jgi:tubulin alpha